MNLYPDDNVTIDYHGRQFMCPEWLTHLLPDEDELPLGAWPTFCGAGDGVGDKIVRDKICGVIISPVCFVHDIGWAIAKDATDFVKENWRFRHNLIAWVIPFLPLWRKPLGYAACYLYWAGVAVLGQYHFNPTECGDWAENPVVRQKLQRLARAKLGIV